MSKPTGISSTNRARRTASWQSSVESSIGSAARRLVWPLLVAFLGYMLLHGLIRGLLHLVARA